MRQITTNLMNKEIIFKSAAEIFKHFLSLFGASPACEKQKINWGVNILRWGLGFIYLWFGVLKFFPQLSSAEQLAGTTIELMTFGLLKPAVSLPLLALWETAIGLALLTGKYQRIAVFSLYFHVPERCFRSCCCRTKRGVYRRLPHRLKDNIFSRTW